MRSTVDQRRLVLAYDDSCSRCRRLAKTVHETTGGQLEVLGLHSEEVHHWLTRHHGGPGLAAWKPTLIEVPVDGCVRVWPGRQMVVPLATRLGLRRSLDVVAAIGRMRARRSTPGGMARRSFLYTAGGAVAGIALLRTGDFSSLVARPISTTTLSGAALQGNLTRLLDGADVRNVVDGRLLEQLRGHDQVPLPRDWPAGQIGLRYAADGTTTVSDAVQLTGGCALAQSAAMTYADGDAESITVITLPREGKVLAHHVYEGAGREVGTEAVVWRLAGADEGLDVLAHSANGAPAKHVSDRLIGLAADGTGEARAQGDNVCGGCRVEGNNAYGEFTAEVCRSSDNLTCAFAAAGCVGCGTACGSGVGTFACVTCLFSTCGPAVRQCCDQRGTACLRCPQQD
jgi:hypothetical protein